MEPSKIGEYIGACRRRLGWSQQQLADVLDVSNKTVSKWETGGGLPDVGSLPALAEALNTTVDNILAGAEKPPGYTLQTGPDTGQEFPARPEAPLVPVLIFRIVALGSMGIGLMGLWLLFMGAGLHAFPVPTRASIFTFVSFFIFIAVYCVMRSAFPDRAAYLPVWRPWAIAGVWLWSPMPIWTSILFSLHYWPRGEYLTSLYIISIIVWVVFSSAMTAMFCRKRA